MTKIRSLRIESTNANLMVKHRPCEDLVTASIGSFINKTVALKKIKLIKLSSRTDTGAVIQYMNLDGLPIKLNTSQMAAVSGFLRLDIVFQGI